MADSGSSVIITPTEDRDKDAARDRQVGVASRGQPNCVDDHRMDYGATDLDMLEQPLQARSLSPGSPQ